jgi:hypothetical protein
MCVRHVASLLVLALVALFPSRADAFFDPPWITPERPVSGETIYVNIHYGECDGIFEEPGYPEIVQDGDAIRMRWYGEHYPEGSGDLLCSFPIATLTSPIGNYSEGDYTLTVELAYRDFFEGPSILTIGVVSFTVAGVPQPAVALPVPALGTTGVFILLAGMLLLSLRSLRKQLPGLLILALTVMPLGGRAQDTGTIRVLLSSAPGAPTAGTVLAWVNSFPRPTKPPLQTFSVKAPVGGDYLIPDRAAGDFLAWLNTNSHSARKRLEDYMLMEFAAADIPAALFALQTDPYVAEAYEPPGYEFSSVGLIDFIVVPDLGPLGGDDQYGYFAMNVDRAWDLAGGYALVGQIDMGLYENHAALRQFTGSTYAGGNFVKTASRDVSLTGRPAQSGFDPLIVDEKKPMWIDAGSCTPFGALLPPAVLGHGTHVAGLLGANSASGLGVQGICKHCGIQMYKNSYVSCYVGPQRNLDRASTGTPQIAATRRP